MLDDVGLLDESLGSYCEDVDLSFRARLQGFQCCFVPAARVYHRLSATGGGPTAPASSAQAKPGGFGGGGFFVGKGG